jgi:uncharacterized protein YneF (UPF0154 family)
MEWLSILVAGIGTIMGTSIGIIFSARLTTYRIQQLEEKVKVHNSIVERMVVMEQCAKYSDERIKEIQEHLENLTV